MLRTALELELTRLISAKRWQANRLITLSSCPMVPRRTTWGTLTAASFILPVPMTLLTTREQLRFGEQLAESADGEWGRQQACGPGCNNDAEKTIHQQTRL